MDLVSHPPHHTMSDLTHDDATVYVLYIYIYIYRALLTDFASFKPVLLPAVSSL